MIPASIRNNNPGAIYPGPAAKKFGGKVGEVLKSRDGSHPIVIFPTPVHGAAALFHNLMHAKGVTGHYYRGRTLSKAIETWCGSIRAQSYLRLIEQQSGIKATDVLSEEFLRDPERAVQLAKAMARHEAGKDYPLEANEWLAAHAMAFGDGVAPEPSPNNDVPTVRPEARAAILKWRAGKWLGGISAGAGTAGVAAPPDLSQIGAWQAATTTVAEMGTWAMTNWHLTALAAGAYLVICHLIPWLKDES